MTYERARSRALVALWLDSHRSRRRFLSRQELAADYGVVLPAEWMKAVASDLSRSGVARLYRDAGTPKLQLAKDAYSEGMTTALSLTGGTQIQADFNLKEIAGDGSFPDDFPGGPGWKYFEFSADPPGDPPPPPPPSPPPAPPSRSWRSKWTTPEVIVAIVGVIVTIAVAVLIG